MPDTKTAASPITASTAMRFHDPLPAQVDVVVIGGGVIGVFAALAARRAGMQVVLLEKGRIAAEQSSRNWGWLRQQGRDEAELPIMMEAMRHWREVDQTTGGRVGFVQAGLSYLASSQQRLAELEQWIAIARRHGLESQMLTQKQLGQIIDQPGGAAHQWLGGLHTASDARAEPWQAVPAVAELAQSEGVIVSEQCAVRLLESTNGNLQAVITERGTIRCEQAVVAAGAWSALFLQRHNFNIPQLTVRQTVVQTEPLTAVINGNAADEQLAFRRRLDGGYTLAVTDNNEHLIGRDSFRHFRQYLSMLRQNTRSTPLRFGVPSGYPNAFRTSRTWSADQITPFERMRVLDPVASAKSLRRIGERFAARFPALGQPPVRNAWAGMIDTMPDIVPIVDRLPGLSGVILATGMSGHGMGIGPGFGQVIARMLMGADPGHDLSRFRFSRFEDGSSAQPGPHI